MNAHHYYLVRKAGSDKAMLVYNFASFSWEDGTMDHDVRTMVFYEQKKWGLWGWDCGTSVIDFEQNEKFEEILAEVSKEEVDALFDVMREAIGEATKWMDDSWKEFSECERSEELNPKNDTTCGCRCEGGKYPFFTFMNDQTHERVCLWSDLLIHGTESDSPFTPDGSWGKYYDIPLSVFEKACELHKTMSNKFVRQYRDFVQAKTGITIPIKEYTPEEIEEEKAKIEERGKALRTELEAMAKLRS